MLESFSIVGVAVAAINQLPNAGDVVAQLQLIDAQICLAARFIYAAYSRDAAADFVLK